ncbi:hypothetical protein JFV29_11995 [Peribacillus sp. TH16]|nr:hypothetical protein [Peribacillus sp. TH16]
MSFSVSDEMNLFSKELQNYLSPSSLQQLAKEVGFVQRTSKYQEQELIALSVCLVNKSLVHPSHNYVATSKHLQVFHVICKKTKPTSLNSKDRRLLLLYGVLVHAHQAKILKYP